jgi:hypothetical protein
MMILNEYQHMFEKIRGHIGIFAETSQAFTFCVSDIEPYLPSSQMQKTESDGETIYSGLFC